MASSTHPSHRAIRIDGRSIRLGFSTDRAGSPPALLLLHGAGMDHRVWAEQLALLGDRGIVASAPDLPGHGGSEGPALTRIAEMADWVLRLVDGIGSREVALAGHSMGALVALEAAGRLGSRLSGLALIGAAAEMPVNPDLLEAASRDLPRAAKMIAAWGYGPAAQADGRAEAGRRIIEAAPPGVLATDLAACAAYRDAPAAAERISAPSLVISGSLDRMTPARRGRALADAIAGAQFQELPEVGHMPMAEAPAELSAALIRLLR